MRNRVPLIGAFAIAFALAACGGSPTWTKEGVSPQHAAAELADCNSEAQRDVGRDVNIDTDIAAGRQHDFNRSQTAQLHRDSDANALAPRSDAIVQACMTGKGYAPGGPSASRDSPHLLNIFGM